jgi:gliding motility-associated-like protein
MLQKLRTGMVITISLFLFSNHPVLAQLQINNSLSPEQWVKNYFLGQGVSISNVSYFSTDSLASGVFSGNSNIGLTEGILITNGIDTLAKGPNNHWGSGLLADYSYPNDLDLSYVQFQIHQFTTPIFNTRTLEFDFIPFGDSISFRYVFASEEYNENVDGPHFNVCGIFISGPGITGNNGIFSNNAMNFALVPDTTIPLCSKTVNNGLAFAGQQASGPCINCSFYIDNGMLDPLDSTRVQYDGFTVPLTVKAKVTPCQTHHLKIGIGKFPNTSFDSGIFLEANSFRSPITTVQTSFSATNNPVFADTFAIEGCRNAVVHIKLPTVKADTQFIMFDSISGSALINTDYTINAAGFQYNAANHTATCTVLPMQDSVDVIVTPIYDGITEGTEDVRFYLKTSICDTIGKCIVIPILDYQDLIADAGEDKAVCESAVQLNLNIQGGIQPYAISWSPASNLSNAFIPNPVANPLQNTWYMAMVQDTVGCSVGIDSVFVKYNHNPAISAMKAVPDSGCELLPVQFSCQSTLPGTFTWNFGDGTTSQDTSPIHVYAFADSGLFNITVRIVTADGCYADDTLPNPVSVFPKPVPDFSFYPDSGIIITQPVINYPFIAFTNLSSAIATNFQWNFGDLLHSTSTLENPSFAYILPGTYNIWLILETSHGCADSISKSIRILNEPQITLEIPNIVTPNNDGKNDRFIIKNLEFCKDHTLNIYNRWGKGLLKSTDYQNDWPENSIPGGTYYYFLEFTLNNMDHQKIGSITVIK